MADRESRFVIGFSGEAGDLTSVLNAVKGQFRSAVAEIEQTTRKVQLFSDLETRTKASAEALFDASAKAKILAAELEKVKAVGGKATDDLTKGLREANREVTTATNAYNRNVDALTKMQRQLSAAGVDTSNLARAQLKLAEASKVAAAAADQQAAKQLLGVKTLADIQPQIAKLNAAYLTLKDSGTLSAKEVAIAQQVLQQKLKETNAQVTTLSSQFKTTGAALSSAFTAAIGPLLGIAATIGIVAAGFASATAAAKDFRNALAEIGTITELSKAELDALGEGARKLATAIGFDLTEGMKALFEIIRSGVSKDNALEVLRVSAEASKAALTDIGTAARVSTLLIDGFGFGVGDLERAFDALIKGGHDGGVTLAQFAESAGPLLNVARSLGVPFNDLVATLTVMTDASKDAQGSIAALTKIMIKLGDPDVQRKLQTLGITSTNLVEVFAQLSERGIPISQIIDLGIASTKTAAGVAALTNNANKLAPELDKISLSAGEMKRSVDAAFDSPKERSERFNAAMHEAGVNIGNAVGSGGQLAVVLTKVATAFNKAQEQGDRENKILSDSFEQFKKWIGIVPEVEPALNAANEASTEFANATKAAGDEAAIATAKVNTAKAALTSFGASLIADAQALQAAGSKEIADATLRADAQIAALDRSSKALATTAEATIAIQTQLAATRLAIIQKNEADILAAVELAAKAREQSQRSAGIGEKQIAAETAKIRIDALAPILAQYQAHYNALVGLAQGHLAKINSIEQERVDFNRGVEKTLFDLRIGSLSALDQYAAKVKEIDKLISEARTAGVNGDIAKAKQYTDQAIALSLTLKEAVNKDGVVVVSAFEAQTKAISEIKKASDGYNESLSKQDDLAKAGLAETQKGLDAVVPVLTDLQTRYDALKATIAEGLDVQVKMDEASVASALATINELTKPRTVVITTQTVQGQSAGGPIVAPAFARGGQVGRVIEAAQRFAGGGSVFRRPTWNKVPGSGSGDTVPAALQGGSFVLRKAASLFYGDSLLGRLAKGYAGGGFINLGGVNWNIEKIDRGVDHSGINSGTSAAMIDPKRGFQSGDSFQTNDPPIQFNPEKIPQALITAMNVIAYAQEMLHMVGVSHPLLGNLGTSMLALLKRLDSDPTDTSAISDLLQQAQTIGANPFYWNMWGKTQSTKGKLTPIWFVDWLKHNRAGDFNRAAKQLAIGGPAGTDTVPAFLTPGEYVMNRGRVDELGTGFMHALNSMAVSRETLAGMLYPAAPRPPVARFATGGLVAGSTVSQSARSGSGGAPGAITVNVTAAAGALLTEDNVRRFIIPVIDGIQRKSR